MQSRGIYHFTHFSFHTEIAVNQRKNPTTLFFPCRKPIVGAGAYAALSHQVPSSVIPNRGLLTARQGGSEPTKPGWVPKIPFHCAFFLWKSLESLAEISPHSLGRAFHSPGGLSTKVATLSGCWMLNLSLAGIQGSWRWKGKGLSSTRPWVFCFWGCAPYREFATIKASCQIPVGDILYAWLSHKVG